MILKAPKARKQREARRGNAKNRRKYRQARWKKIREQVISRDKGRCQQCLRTGHVKLGSEVDHILKAEDNQELFYELRNLQLLCRKCHSIKTARGE